LSSTVFLGSGSGGCGRVVVRAVEERENAAAGRAEALREQIAVSTQALGVAEEACSRLRIDR
jgi:hypothetical protein